MLFQARRQVVFFVAHTRAFVRSLCIWLVWTGGVHCAICDACAMRAHTCKLLKTFTLQRYERAHLHTHTCVHCICLSLSLSCIFVVDFYMLRWDVINARACVCVCFSLVVTNSNGYVYLMILIFYVAIEFQYSLSFDAPPPRVHNRCSHSFILFPSYLPCNCLLHEALHNHILRI